MDPHARGTLKSSLEHVSNEKECFLWKKTQISSVKFFFSFFTKSLSEIYKEKSVQCISNVISHGTETKIYWPIISHFLLTKIAISLSDGYLAEGIF